MARRSAARWPIFYGDNGFHPLTRSLPAPPWREFTREARRRRGQEFKVSKEAIEMVNAALLLRRPLLITGKPGTGKSSLAYAIAEELRLGDVLVWPITTRSTLQQGLYSYDAIARLQDASLARSKDAQADTLPEIGRYLRLGPVGTALADSEKPRVLLIDEIDKSDIDLPNDLLHIFEEGEFEIPELARLPREPGYERIEVLTHDRPDAEGGATEKAVPITRGRVRCRTFPFVLLTSNGEREFPPAFLRRCLRLQMNLPTEEELRDIIRMRLPGSEAHPDGVDAVIQEFLDRRDGRTGGGAQEISTDQLLNAVFMVLQGVRPLDRELLREALLKPLTGTS